MAGNRLSGLKAAAKIKERYGEDFYVNAGRKGGSAPRVVQGGFATEWQGKDGLRGPVRASIAGSLGGAHSRRGHKFIRCDGDYDYYTRDGEIVRYEASHGRI